MFHKAVDLKFNKGTTLTLTFRNGEVKEYDISCLFNKYPQLKKLKNRDLFLSGKLVGQYGIIWNEELDIEVETIYNDGKLVDRIIPYANALVGDAIANARAKANLSQMELASKSGVDQSDISKIERGVANPSLSTLNRLAQAMGMELQIDLK